MDDVQLPQPEFSTRKLLAEVTQYLGDKYGPPAPGAVTTCLPQGLRLEMHPLVYRQIVMDPDHDIWPSRAALSERFGVEVKLADEIPEGTWRLVIMTVKVLLDGKA